MQTKDISSMRFGRLTALRFIEKSKHKHSVWECKCDCGKTKNINLSSLTRGLTTSCGCFKDEAASNRCSARFLKDLTGREFGRLTVLDRDIEYQKNHKSKSAFWKCKCICGKSKTICGSNLLRKSGTQSCGCLGKELAVQRGKDAGLPFGQSAKNETYGRYKRQAKQRFLDFDLDFDEFISLVSYNCYYCGTTPSNKISTDRGSFVYNGIDRQDNALGYVKNNCVACCQICNRAKADLTMIEFANWVKRLQSWITR